ncbi:MAG TPA: hypothetical protein VK838_00675, partial [Candidatus Limnocylindrales bacterium]|nr:hypothetical protein [Candidatus Limnocylindrales bacterium]
RCLAYGRGITYWPVAEALRDGAGLAEDDPPETTAALLHDLLGSGPDAVRIADIVGGLLGIEGSPPAADEMFWAIRKTFEAMARRRPLVLVFDVVHWGEPTFLDLIDHIADWTRNAPILLIAMARPELLEKRPAWGGGKRWVTTMSLEPLSEVESEELVASLLGRIELPARLRDQISGAAEGNPLFVEELLGKLIDDGFLVAAGEGWITSGDMGQLVIPPSVQALLAARLDGLGTEERAIIQRAAVEGKIFHRGAVMELAPEPMRGQVPERLASLMRMELVRPEEASFAGDEAYRFRHLLIRDAAYQALAKQTRSELHERFAAWLQRVAADRLTEYQEIIAYHLEQAYQYRTELGPPDAAARELGMRAGMLLADAGLRASQRGDVAATIDLLERAVVLLPEETARERKLLFTLGAAYYDAADTGRADAVLSRAVAGATQAGDEGASALAAAGLVFVRSSTRSAESADSQRELERLALVLERTGDVTGARLATAWAAFYQFSLGQAELAARRSMTLVDLGPADEPWYQEAVGAMASSLIWGATPVREASAILQAQVERAGGRPAVAAWLTRNAVLLHALEGRFEDAREANTAVRAVLEELGQRYALVWRLYTEGLINHLTGDLQTARQQELDAYEAMTASGDRSYASTMAVGLGEVLLDLDDLDEAWRYATIARDTSAADDVASQAGGRAVQARVMARRGEHRAAEELAREAEATFAATDYLWYHGDTAVHLAHVLRDAGKTDDAVAVAGKAAELYEQKGATFLAERTRQLIADWTA